MTAEKELKIVEYCNNLVMNNAYICFFNKSQEAQYREILSSEFYAEIEKRLKYFGYLLLHDENTKTVFAVRDPASSATKRKSKMSIMESRTALQIAKRYFNNLYNESSNTATYAWNDLIDDLKINTSSDKKSLIEAVWMLVSRNIISINKTKSDLSKEDPHNQIQIHIYSAIASFINMGQLSEVNEMLDSYVIQNCHEEEN